MYRKTKKLAIILSMAIVMLFIGNINYFSADTSGRELSKTEFKTFSLKPNTDLEKLTYRSTFSVTLKFDFGQAVVKENDYFIVTLPEELRITDNNEISLLKNKKDEHLANVYFDKVQRTAKVVFTNGINNKTEISGDFYIFVGVNVKQDLQKELQFHLGNEAISLGNMVITKPNDTRIVNGENLFKSGAESKVIDIDNNKINVLEYFIRINRVKNDHQNFTLYDEIKASGKVKFIPESFKLYRVGVHGENDDIEKPAFKEYEQLKNAAPGEPSLKISLDGKKFELNIPNIGQHYYRLEYMVTNPLTGETITNIAYSKDGDKDLIAFDNFKGKNIFVKEDNAVSKNAATIRAKEILQLVKEDFNGNPLAGIRFSLQKDGDSTNPILNETDDQGRIEFRGLVQGRYTIKEISENEIYEKHEPVRINFNPDDGAILYIVNQPKLVDIKVEKEWVGTERSKFKSKFALMRKVGDEKFSPALDEFGDRVEYFLDLTQDPVDPQNSERAVGSFTFKNMRKYDDAGNKYEYKIVEEDIPSGFESTIENKNNDPYVFYIVNKEIPPIKTVDIQVSKKWEGDFDTPTKEVELTLQIKLPQEKGFSDFKENNLKKTFTISEGVGDTVINLGKYPKIDALSGEPYQYKVIETPIQGYEAHYFEEVDLEGNYTVLITNKKISNNDPKSGNSKTPDDNSSKTPKKQNEPDPDLSETSKNENASGTKSSVERIIPKETPLPNSDQNKQKEEKEEKKEKESEKSEPKEKDGKETPKPEEVSSKNEKNAENTPQDDESTPEGITDSSLSNENETKVLPSMVAKTSSQSENAQKSNVSPEHLKKLPKTGDGLNNMDQSLAFMFIGSVMVFAGYQLKKRKSL